MTQLDQRALRDVLGTFVTGVTVVTTRSADGKLHGVTANSFSSVSLVPPLVLWSQALSARSYPAFDNAERFVVNILAQDQAVLSRHFASRTEDKFLSVKVRNGIGQLPIIEGCAAYLECRKVQTYPGGDHSIFIGEVESFGRMPCSPLAFGAGRYLVAHPHDSDVASASEVDATNQLEALRIVTAALPDVAARIGATLGLAVWGNRGATVVHWQSSGSAPLRNLRFGTVVSPVLSASGQLFAAYLEPARADPLIEEEFAALHAARVEQVPSREVYRARLLDIRNAGYACSTPQTLGPGLTSVSVPIHDASGEVMFALTAVHDQSKIDAEYTLARRLVEDAVRLSARLGHRRPELKEASA